jgi:hypothetical protein
MGPDRYAAPMTACARNMLASTRSRRAAPGIRAAGLFDKLQERWRHRLQQGVLKAYEDGRGGGYLAKAFHETLAEIAAVQWRTGKVDAAPVWKSLCRRQPDLQEAAPETGRPGPDRVPQE